MELLFCFLFSYWGQMHKTVLISFFEIRTVCLRGHGAAKNGLQMHNTRLNVSAVQIHILSIWPCTCNTRVCNEFDMLLCPAVKAFSFINAIGHPLSLDARPHKATLVALSLRHCHLCVCIPSYLHERKKRFMWHTCAPRGSDRKRASVRRPPPSPTHGYKESVADSVTRPGYCFN